MGIGQSSQRNLIPFYRMGSQINCTAHSLNWNWNSAHSVRLDEHEDTIEVSRKFILFHIFSTKCSSLFFGWISHQRRTAGGQFTFISYQRK